MRLDLRAEAGGTSGLDEFADEASVDQNPQVVVDGGAGSPRVQVIDLLKDLLRCEVPGVLHKKLKYGETLGCAAEIVRSNEIFNIRSFRCGQVF